MRVPMRSETYSKMNWQERRMIQVQKKVRPGAAKSTKIRAVCGNCNNKWMSRIENLSKPILSPMIKGLHSELDILDQETIAKWISLRILLGEQMTPSAITSQDVRRTFMTNPQPLKGLRIWTARCGAPTWQSAYHRRSTGLYYSTTNPIATDRQHNIQSVALGIGSLFFYVIHSVTILSVYPEFHNADRFLQLWPLVYSPMTWPPLMAITSFEADGVARAIETLADAPMLGSSNSFTSGAPASEAESATVAASSQHFVFVAENRSAMRGFQRSRSSLITLHCH
jgi:hypothetical protein